jgi:hypothetical protein
LVSKLAYKPNTSEQQQQQQQQQQQPQVLVWKHTLPMVRPSKQPMSIPLGGISMASTDTLKILNELGGNLQKYQGHLGLGLKTNGYFPLLLEIRDPSEVVGSNSQLMLEVLLSPQRLKHHQHPPTRKERVSGTQSINDETLFNNMRQKNTPKKGSTQRARRGRR